MNYFRSALLLAPWWILLVGIGCAEEEGLYADFTTSHGQFTARLEFEKVPRTTANFVGLASGTVPWIAEESGCVKWEPFYAGVGFHRVVEGFVIQAGTRSGDGSGGPGYTFRDEFDPALRHDAPYVLSMANSGLHSNGSQFFITLAEKAFLDGIHSVFGKVITGTEVIDRIGRVSVDLDDRPLEPVVIEAVSVRRVGSAAHAFEVSAFGLPRARNVQPSIGSGESGQFDLRFPQAANRALTLYRSEDLQSWTSQSWPIVSETRSQILDLNGESAAVPDRFYRLVEVEYAEPVLTPGSVAGQKLTLAIVSHSWDLELSIDASGSGGTYVFNGGERTALKSVDWRQEAYRGVIVLQFPDETVVPMRAELVFQTATSGYLIGRVFQSPPFAMAGTFTVAPLAP